MGSQPSDLSTALHYSSDADRLPARPRLFPEYLPAAAGQGLVWARAVLLLPLLRSGAAGGQSLASGIASFSQRSCPFAFPGPQRSLASVTCRL